jgi:O-antigen ligase
LPEGFYGHLHNIYLQYAAERGIPATLFMVAFLIWPAWLWFQTARRLPQDSTALWALNLGIAVVIGVLITGIFEHNLGDSEVLALTLSALGATEAVRREVRLSAGV